jgi:hypothetical protein
VHRGDARPADGQARGVAQAEIGHDDAIGCAALHGVAAIVSFVLILSRKVNGKSEVPFGPFIAIGTFIAMLYGWNIIEFYMGFMPV